MIRATLSHMALMTLALVLKILLDRLFPLSAARHMRNEEPLLVQHVKLFDGEPRSIFGHDCVTLGATGSCGRTALSDSKDLMGLRQMSQYF
jgi:hypothetical protein